MSRYRNIIFALTFAVLGIFSAAILITPAVSAQGGGVGGGGGAGGCTSCGGASTDNGYGWYKFSSGAGAGGPVRIKDDPTPWSSVQSFCRDSGNDSIIAFIILQGSGGPGNSVSYKYQTSEFNKYYDYKGDDGGDWVSHELANAYYNNVPASAKVGYTWGTNVAWFCYNFANQWNINGQSYIQNGKVANRNAAVGGQILALPGERLNWYHDLRNVGPQTMDKAIYYNIGKVGFSNGWNGNADPQGWVSGGVNALFVTAYATYGSPYTLYDVTQSDVGNNLCQRINWQALSWNNGGVGSSGYACAYIPYSYALVPEISNITDDSMIEGGAGAVPVQARVTNTGATKSHTNIQWQITQVKYKPGVAQNNKNGGISASNPCAYFTGNQQCGVTSSGSGTEAGGYGYRATTGYSASGNLGDEPVGTRLCFAMSIKRNSSDSTDWRHSKLYCLVVGKKPKVQVFGGDLIVGRGYTAAGAKISANVVTSASQKDGTYYGSWSEYAILPSGFVTSMASGSGFAGGVATRNLCSSLSLLTFANASNPTTPTCDNTKIGKYSLTSPSQLDGIAARFTPPAGASVLNGDVKVEDLAARTIYSGSGTINLTAGAGYEIPAGKWVVINAPGADVRISNNIKYTSAALTKASDIPQLVIIARNIVIADTVTNVDSWLFAKGTGANGIVNTCDSPVIEPVKLTSTVCDAPLTINGPVISNHLLLYRTAGSGTGAASGDPAEVFNLRPDAYMWASTFAGDDSKARTVMTTELPPRF